MAQRLVALALLLVAGCGRLGFDPLDSPDDLVDPDAEGPLAIDYGRRWAVLARGGEIRALEPRVVGEAADFTVTPALPDGLAIDPTTGIIAGIAPELASSSTYTITAGGSLRSASFELVLDIRTAVEVDSTTDTADLNPGDGICDSGLGDCTLRAAVEEANATGEPVVVTVPPGTYPLASQIQIRAEVAVVGAGTRQTVLDGQLMTRVLKSIDGGVAHISDLDIRRGAGTGGSALEVFNAVAHLSNVVVAQNIQGGDGGAGLKYTSNAVGTIEYSTIADNVGDGGGGGLNVNGSTVDIYRTRFVNNSAAGRGGGLSLFGDTALVTIDSSS
ncbi:MAG: glycoside hydrolase family 55 protein, partial [Deltaproteobacteria bacterium]|nr:glycoside hydrolase family 55 protein [Deltaproteobacteria bacterium]